MADPEPAAQPSSPPLGDLVLLGVAVLAVSTSAPLIRGAAAPTLAIAAWRNVLSVPGPRLVGGGAARRTLGLERSLRP